MPSFSTSLSGLDANSQDLAVISNNLANLNTTAYKGGSAAFQDLFYQQLGSSGNGSPIQVGVGVKVGSIPTDFTQGTIQSDGVPTDLAIQGAGFLVGDLGGQQVFLRAGNLSLSPAGVLLGPDGSTILGNQAVNGVIDANQTPGPLTISTGLINPPKASANAELSINLDSATPAGGTFSTALTVFDSLGASHISYVLLHEYGAGQMGLLDQHSCGGHCRCSGAGGAQERHAGVQRIRPANDSCCERHWDCDQ